MEKLSFISRSRNISNSVFGTIIIVSGVIMISPDSLLIRCVSNVPNFTVGFYRFIFCTVSSIIFFLIASKQKWFEKIKYFGWIGTIAGLIWGLQNFTIVYSIQMTSAANALVIFALNPIFASILSYFILSQTIPLRTLLTSIICFGCIAFIFYSELSGHTTVNNIIGNVSALTSSFLLGLFFVICKLSEKKFGYEPDIFLCNVVAGLVSAIVSLLCGGAPSPSSTTTTDILFLMLQGFILLPVCLTMFTYGSQFLYPAETSLYMLIGPIWVYLAGFEAPPKNTIYGGTILIISLAIHSYLSLQAERRDQVQTALANEAQLEVEIDVENENSKNDLEVLTVRHDSNSI